MSYFTEVKIVDKTTGDAANINANNEIEVALESVDSSVEVTTNVKSLPAATLVNSVQSRITRFDSSGTEAPLASSDDPNHNKIVGVDYVSGNSGVDASTETLQTIDYEHHEIHAGSEYRAGFQKDIPNGGTAAFAITTPDTTTWLHFKLAIDVEQEAQVAFYENPDSVTVGTSVTPRNANRNVADSSVATCVSDPTYTIGSATPLSMLVLGSGKSSGGDTASANEWVLKQNTTYLVVVTNQATGASNECNIRCRWYEHANKN